MTPRTRCSLPPFQTPNPLIHTHACTRLPPLLQANARLSNLQQQVGSSQQDITRVRQELADAQVCVHIGAQVCVCTGTLWPAPFIPHATTLFQGVRTSALSALACMLGTLYKGLFFSRVCAHSCAFVPACLERTLCSARASVYSQAHMRACAPCSAHVLVGPYAYMHTMQRPCTCRPTCIHAQFAVPVHSWADMFVRAMQRLCTHGPTCKHARIQRLLPVLC